MGEPPVAFHDLPASAFPFTVETIRSDTGEVVDRQVVTGPGALAVKGAADVLGVPMGVRITWANGQVTQA